VEFVAGALFVFFYWMFFVRHVGPCVMQFRPPGVAGPMVTVRHVMGTIHEHWPIYVLLMFMVASLLAVSLIDAELFIIPLGIPWLMAVVGIVVHAIVDRPNVPGALNLAPGGIAGGMALGGGVGLLISIILFQLKILPMSFAEGEPMLDHERQAIEQGETTASMAQTPVREYSSAEVRAEMRHEMAFLMPALVLSAIGGYVGLSSFMPILLRDQYRLSAVTAGYLTALAALAGSGLRPVGGWVADKIGGVRLLSVLLGGIAAMYFAASRLPAIALMIAVLVAAMVCLGLGNGAVFQLVPQRFRNEMGVMTGLVGMFGGVGGFYLASTLGLAKQWTGSYQIGLLGFAALALAALAGLTLVKAKWRTSWGMGGAQPARI
jgi:nitrate/nitrite transporter NarK